MWVMITLVYCVGLDTVSAAFPDEGWICELAERIRLRCKHAQQLKVPGQPVTAAGSLQIAQAEKIQLRLREQSATESLSFNCPHHFQSDTKLAFFGLLGASLTLDDVACGLVCCPLYGNICLRMSWWVRYEYWHVHTLVHVLVKLPVCLHRSIGISMTAFV